jgi:TolB-like protein/tetratricopeptide (TPR) repeat protein
LTKNDFIANWEASGYNAGLGDRAMGEQSQESVIRFGPFELDAASWELRRLDRRIKIRPQACKVLALLVNRSGQVVSRDELCQHVWAKDTFVDFEHSLNFCVRQIRKALGESAGSPRYLETIPRRGYRFTAVATHDFHSLAILPFENVSGDPSLDYLSDGITESLIRQLAQLPGLQVIGRTTVFRFKGRKLQPEAVGRRLGVGAVLTGRLLQRDGRLLIDADLIDVNGGLHLWGEHYDRSGKDVVIVQQEISRGVSTKLCPHVSGSLRNRVKNWGTNRVEAYHSYLRGRHFANKSGGQGFHKGIQYFAEAIDNDPTYGLAYAGLADCYGYLGFYGYIPPRESFPKARAAASRALQIDDTLAEGHSSLGLVELFYDWNPEAAYARCLHAIELNPSYPPTYLHAAGCLIAMMRSAEASAMMAKAQVLDPLAVWVHTVAGLIAYLGRDYDRACRELQRALELEPQTGEAHRALGITYLQMDQTSRAITELEAARALLGETQTALGSLGRAYGCGRMMEEAEQILVQLKAVSAQQSVAAASTAAVYVGLGQHEQALDWLERAVQNRSSWLVWLNAEPWWDPLRDHPRFQSIRDRIRPREIAASNTVDFPSTESTSMRIP